VCFSTEAKVPTYDPMVKPGTDEPYGTYYWSEDGTRVEGDLAGDDSRLIVDRVVDFVRESAAERRPFLAVVWFHTPHLPVLAAPGDRAPYRELPDATAHYYGAVRAMDREVGRLRAELERLRLDEDTIVWFCSDNGPEGRAGRAPGSAGPLRGRKRSLYEGGIRVPGMVVWPAGIRPGTSSAVPAVTSDFLPTLAALCGVPVPGGVELDGRDLTAVLRGERTARGARIGFESGGRVAWTGDRYKLVGRGAAPRPRGAWFAVDRWELYDLLEDPGEAEDLAERRPDVLRRMVDECEAWRRSVRADAR
jgi:arylsulfatase A-like enzyme